MANLFNRIIKFCVRRPLSCLSLIGIFLIASLLSLPHIKFKTSNLDLIGQNLVEVKRFLDFSEEFGNPNFIVMVFEGDNENNLKMAVDKMAPVLRTLEGVHRVIDKIPLGPKPYFSSINQKMFFVFIQPLDKRTNVEAIDPLLKRINQAIENAQFDGTSITVGLTGIPQYAINDRDIIQKDISFLSIVSLVLILIIFIGGFHSFRRPFIATLTLGLSVILSLGFVVIYPGHLTLLSAPFAAMIFGLGIDYGIHIINLLEDKLAQGCSEEDAIFTALKELRRPLTTGALTTAGVFFVLTQSGFLGFKELGIIAGVGIIICLIMMFTALPALLSLLSKKGPSLKPPPSKLGQILARPRFKWVAPILLALTVFFIFTKSPGFDSNYLNLQPKNSNAVRLERQMIEMSEYSPNFAVFKADSEEKAAELTQILRKNKSVGHVRSITDLSKMIPPGMPLPPLPDGFKDLFISPAGHYAVYAYPEGNIWDPKIEQEFLFEMKSIDPKVTGMPFLGNLMVDRSKRALVVTAKIAIFVLLILLALDFKKPLPIILTLIPPLMTIAWMRGLMSVFDIPFNPLNVMALPIVLGIAVDDGVHIMHRFLLEKGDLTKTLIGTGRSVVLTSFTTIAAFGTLAFTSHLGLRSFSLALTIGVASALVISIFFFPWCLFLLKRRILKFQIN